MTEQHDEAMRAAVENATKMAVVNKKGGAAEEKTEADAEENTAPETKMDTEPDPEFQAMMEELDTAVKEQQRQKEIADAEKAEENARQQHQKEMAEKVQDAVRKALEEANDYHEKEKNKLIAANKAAEVARQTQEAPDKVTQTKSSDVVHRQTSGHPVDLTLAVTEADEANNLLEEVVKNGVAKGTIEHAALQRLTEIRLALHNVKKALQLPHPTTDTGYYADILRGFRLEESVLERLDTGTNHQSLVRQGRLANERLKKVSEILETSGVQKDALLQALLGPRREVKPIRGLKRPAQSKKPKVDNGQPPADVPPTPPAKPKADNRQSFASIMASLQNS